MEYITSANIACGGHAGDEATMERTARLAMDAGVRIGAHPGYPDRASFGRLELPMTAGEIESAVLEQILRLNAVVERLGGAIRHVKPHGALYNVAAKNEDVARAIGAAVALWNPGVTLFGLAGSRMPRSLARDGPGGGRRGLRRPALRTGWLAAAAPFRGCAHHRPARRRGPGYALRTRGDCRNHLRSRRHAGSDRDSESLPRGPGWPSLFEQALVNLPLR